jgi:predicted unusual protein kinase regulating ubiquinone biosynthesis (AarF/ABC1/UbiB family)
MKRLEEATTLASEILEIAASTGTNGVTRTFSALDALTKLAVRTAQTYADDPAAAPPTPASALRQTFEALGATYVKLGQFIASAPSAFPKEFVDEFQKCLDETPATPFAEMRAIVEEELREKGAGSVEDVFSFVDPTPLASASVAQVHRATLRGSNKDVVIKILKPDVEATLSADLSFALVAAKVLQFLNPELSRASLVDIVGDVRASMLEETDFRKEAENVAAFTRRVLSDTGPHTTALAW